MIQALGEPFTVVVNHRAIMEISHVTSLLEIAGAKLNECYSISPIFLNTFRN